MRRSSLFFLYLSIYLVLMGSLFVHASFKRKTDSVRLREGTRLVENLGLTDLCLFTEASYTRHVALADLHTPFQDSPTALEHFPSGSLVPPPRFARGIDEPLH